MKSSSHIFDSSSFTVSFHRIGSLYQLNSSSQPHKTLGSIFRKLQTL